MDKKTIEKVDLKGKRVFVRADFNVPLDENGNITDDTRIRSTLPTINYALDQGAKVILASHLGRPKGKPSPKYSLAPVATRLGRILSKEVHFAKDCVGPDVEHLVHGMRPGDVLPIDPPADVTLYAGDQPLYAGKFGVSRGRNALKILKPLRRRSP